MVEIGSKEFTLGLLAMLLLIGTLYSIKGGQ